MKKTLIGFLFFILHLKINASNSEIFALKYAANGLQLYNATKQENIKFDKFIQSNNIGLYNGLGEIFCGQLKKIPTKTEVTTYEFLNNPGKTTGFKNDVIPENNFLLVFPHCELKTYTSEPIPSDYRLVKYTLKSLKKKYTEVNAFELSEKYATESSLFQFNLKKFKKNLTIKGQSVEKFNFELYNEEAILYDLDVGKLIVSVARPCIKGDPLPDEGFGTEGPDDYNWCDTLTLEHLIFNKKDKIFYSVETITMDEIYTRNNLVQLGVGSMKTILTFGNTP